MVYAIVVIPLAVSLLGLFKGLWRWVPRLASALMVAQVPVAVWLCAPALSGDVPDVASGFGMDGVGAAFVLITTVVSAAAMLQAALLLPAERSDATEISNRQFCLFYTWSGLFIAAMYGVLLAQNLGYMWIAMEMTTLMSAPLIFFHRSRLSLEATWKYLLLCSVGIAFALFGTVLVFASSQNIASPR